MRKRLGIIALAVCMLLGLSSCGSGEEISNVSLQGRLNQDRIYYAVEAKMDMAEAASADFGVYGYSIYYPEGQSIKTYDIREETTTADTYTWADATGQWAFGKISYSGRGEVYALVNVGSNNVAGDFGTPYLCKFDTQRNSVFAKSLVEYYQESGVIYSATDTRLEVGADDRVYLGNSTGVWIFEEDGSYKGEVAFGSAKDVRVLDFISDSDRNLYVLYEDGNNGNQYVAEIDTEKGALTAVQQTIGLTGLGTAEWDGNLIGYNQALVYLYDRAECALYELFHWAECKVDGTVVSEICSLTNASFLVAGTGAQDGVFTSVVRSMDASGKGNFESGKIDIVIGGGGGRNELLSEAVKWFNSSNGKYNVVVENYSGVANAEGMALLESKIAAGLGPDILELSQDNVKVLLENGYLEDLSLYLEGSSIISEGDFLDFALKEYRMDGMLLAIPHHFSISLLVGNSDFLGEEPGWTLEDIVTLLEQNEGTQVFAKEMRRRDIFQFLLYMNEDMFVDRETGTCDFNQEIFRRIVDLAGEYPIQYRTISEKEKDPIGLPELENGSGIVCQVTGQDFQCLQPYEGALAGKINYIGYPNEGSGISAEIFDSFGILSTSPYKEGAWEFLEYYLQFVSSERNVKYFPTYRPVIQTLANRTMESGYKGDKYYGYEMWGFEHYRPEQAEMDNFCELLERANPEQFDDGFMEIILEEMERYYPGEIDVDSAIANIEREIQAQLAQ